MKEETLRLRKRTSLIFMILLLSSFSGVSQKCFVNLEFVEGKNKLEILLRGIYVPDSNQHVVYPIFLLEYYNYADTADNINEKFDCYVIQSKLGDIELFLVDSDSYNIPINSSLFIKLSPKNLTLDTMNSLEDILLSKDANYKLILKNNNHKLLDINKSKSFAICRE